MRLTKTFTSFFESEKAGGIILIFVTAFSLFLANSEVSAEYLTFWNSHIGHHTVTEWINDGLMTIFFLMVGLELEREIYIGELSNFKNAALPIFGALGGMIVPAGLYLLLNFGTATQNGAGIPMATDIAFAIGILSLLGNKVPTSLKVFLTALAVIDDLGAILVIAIFYTKTIAFMNLAIAGGILAFLFLLNRLKVYNVIPYLIGGCIMWYFMLSSGVHATITGVLVAFVIPFEDGGTNTISYKLQHFLHNPVNFFILPIFALANTCIPIGADWAAGLNHENTYGIMLGLIVGKPLGIFLLSFASVALGICVLPRDLKWSHIVGAGMLGGIGFTMSIFVTILAFTDLETINYSKIAILIASFVSGIIGFMYLKFGTPDKVKRKVSTKKR